MGTYYTLHCEAKIGGVWRNIDFYRKTGDNKYEIVPLIEGKSFVGAAVNWYDLSAHTISRDLLASDTLLAHPSSCPEYQSWAVFDYHEIFGNRDYEVPECCGYASRAAMNLFRAEHDDDYLQTISMNLLTPESYAKLTPEAQRGFEYVEFTIPFGLHDVMRTIQRGVNARISCANRLDGSIRIVILTQ